MGENLEPRTIGLVLVAGVVIAVSAVSTLVEREIGMILWASVGAAGLLYGLGVLVAASIGERRRSPRPVAEAPRINPAPAEVPAEAQTVPA